MLSSHALQNVFVTGDAPCLGRWSRSAAVPCACKHEGKRLVWETSISAPVTPELRYKYLVLDEEGQVEHTDEQERCLRLPKSLQPGELVHVQDHWQVNSVACRRPLSSFPVLVGGAQQGSWLGATSAGLPGVAVTQHLFEMIDVHCMAKHHTLPY